MAYQLAIVKGRSENEVVRIMPGNVLTVGRQDGCQLRIGSSQVSRKHCEIEELAGKLMVRDLHSSNGTLVDGLRIEGEVELKPGQSLTIGPVVFRIESQRAQPPGSIGSSTSGTTANSPSGTESQEIDYEIEASDSSTKQISPAKSASPRPVNTPMEPSEDQPIELGEDDVLDFLTDLEDEPQNREPQKKK